MTLQELRHRDIEDRIGDDPAGNTQPPPDSDEKDAPRSKTGTEEFGSQNPSIPVDVTTPQAKLVYVYLWLMVTADLSDLSRATRVPQIQLLPVLKSLSERNHVESDGLKFSISRVA